MKGEPESSASLYWVVEEFIRVRAYLRTLRAIKKRIPLWTWTEAEREEAGFLGPWTFNLYESALAAFPAGLLLAVVMVFLPSPTEIPFAPVKGDQLFVRVAPQVTGIASSFIVSMISLALSGLAAVSVAGWKNRELRRRLTAVYLYYDGRTGFLGQMLFSLTLVAVALALNGYKISHINNALPSMQDDARRFWLLVMYVSLAYASFWAVPMAMLREAGYSGWVASRGKPATLPPAYLRYVAVMASVGSVAALAVYLGVMFLSIKFSSLLVQMLHLVVG